MLIKRISAMAVSVGAPETWTLCGTPAGLEKICVQTSLTHSVHAALFAAGKIPDPITAFNDEALRWIAETEWTFSAEGKGWGKSLFFETITGPAEVVLDQVSVLQARNAFLPYRVPLEQAPQRINIKFQSPVALAKALKGAEVPDCPPGVFHGICGAEYLRMAQMSFGWDWGPAFASVGFVLAEDPGVFDFTAQVTKTTGWAVALQVANQGGQNVHVTVAKKGRPKDVILDQDVSLSSAGAGVVAVDVHAVVVWNIRGRGEQALYDLKVCLTSGECKSRTIGFREMQFSSTGALILNGEAVIMRGANMVPMDALGGLDGDIMERLKTYIIDSGMNIIRVWGGGIYGPESLYDWADAKGILMWEEVNLACASYPVDEEFLGNLERELEFLAKRIHSHPSLVLLSGDNEVAQMLEGNWYGADYDRMKLLKKNYYEVLRPRIVDSLGTTLAHVKFIPTSPVGGFDIHHYNYGSNCRDVGSFPRGRETVSEFGYQSWSSAQCLADQGGVDVSENFSDSKPMQWRQHRPNGNNEIQHGVHFVFADTGDNVSVEGSVWYSQVSQAICMKSSAETFIRQGRNGVLYWQLNEVWPGASWSMLDWCGLRKPAWYYTRQVFNDLSREPMVYLYAMKNQLAVDGAQVGSLLVVVDLLTGSVTEKTVTSSEMRLSLSDICPRRNACVAAVSATNYYLIGHIDRGEHQFDPLAIRTPLEVRRDDRVHIRAIIPTAFIFIYCKDHLDINFSENMLFLFPTPGWDTVSLPVPSGCGDRVKILHSWSFTPPLDHKGTLDL